MNTMQIFNFENNDVRTHVINDEPWFVGKDVAEVLEYVPASFRVIPRSPEARLCGMIGQRARPSVDLFAAKAEFEAHDPSALKSRHKILVQIPHKSPLFQ